MLQGTWTGGAEVASHTARPCCLPCCCAHHAPDCGCAPVAIEAPEQALCPKDEAAPSCVLGPCRLQHAPRCRRTARDGAELRHVERQHHAVLGLPHGTGRGQHRARILGALAAHLELAGLRGRHAQAGCWAGCWAAKQWVGGWVGSSCWQRPLIGWVGGRRCTKQRCRVCRTGTQHSPVLFHTPANNRWAGSPPHLFQLNAVPLAPV